MQIFDNFESNIMSWLEKYGLNEVKSVQFGKDFTYNITDHIINIGTSNEDESDEWFEEYLTNKGCRCAGIPADILSFLHEVGHSCTIHKLMNQFGGCRFIDNCADDKTKIYHNAETLKEGYMAYWNVADELAANEWEIRFINENQSAVVELYDIWNESIDMMANAFMEMMMSAA